MVSAGELIFGQMKERQGAGYLPMRGIGACKGAVALHPAVHSLGKLRRESVRRQSMGRPIAVKHEDRA